MDNAVTIKQRQMYLPMVDVFKLGCALLVVMIHCVEIRGENTIATRIVDVFAGQAVPFFMIVSGFFLGNKLVKNADPLRTALKSAKSWLMIYFAWTVIWTPYFIGMYLNRYPEKSTLYIIAMLARRYLFAGQGVYWYLLVLAEASIVLGICVKYKKEKMFYAVAIVGMALGFIYDIPLAIPGAEQINQMFYVIFSWSNNIVMKGIPYVAIGYFFSTHRTIVNRLKVKIGVGLYILIVFLSLIVYDGTPRLMYFSYPMQAVLLFVIAIQMQPRNLSDRIPTVCRNMSTVVYYLHTFFIYFLIDPLFTVDAPVVLKFGISVGGCALSYLIAARINWKPLNWILGIKVIAS